MAEEMKTTPVPEEQRPEPPAPETPDAPAPLRPEALTVEEQLILEHEGRAALFEMGEVFPDVPEFPGVATLKPPSLEQGTQVVLPGMEGPPPPENKVIDLSSVRAGAGPEQQAAPEGGQEWEKPQEEEKKPRRGRPPKDKEAPAQGDKPKRKGRPPKAEKQAPGRGDPGKSAKAPRQSKPGPANPDEYLNHALKIFVHSGQLPYTAEDISHKIQSFMRRLQHHPSAVSSFFLHPFLSCLFLQK